jgi:hypothetical protein
MLYDKYERINPMEFPELQGSKIISYEFDKETEDHILNLECGCIQSASLFRIIEGNNLKLTSLDDNQLYGLRERIEFRKECNTYLKQKIIVKSGSNEIGDLELFLENGIRIEFIRNYTGYEAWQIYLKNGKEYIASGNQIKQIQGNKIV